MGLLFDNDLKRALSDSVMRFDFDILLVLVLA
jgi:hypothetical protein